VSVKATSLADHGGISRDEDRVAVFVGMKIIEDVSMTSRTSGVVKRLWIAVVGIVVFDNYRIVKGTDWGSRS